MAAKATRSMGTVSRFNDEKGYGFIKKDDGTGDVFVHQSNIISDGFRALKPGQKVEFTVASKDERSYAINVTGPKGATLPGAVKCYTCGEIGHAARDCDYNWFKGQRVEYRVEIVNGERRAVDVTGPNGKILCFYECYTCGEMGHMARNCDKCSKCLESGHIARDCDKCYNCWESGHIARDCDKCLQSGHIAKDYKTKTKTQKESQSKSNTETKSESKSNTETMTEIKTESKTESKPESKSKRDTPRQRTRARARRARAARATESKK